MDHPKKNHGFLLLLVYLLLLSQGCQSWDFWSSSSSSSSKETPNENPLQNSVLLSSAEFTMDNQNERGRGLVEKAKNMMTSSSNSCWQNAYGNLFAGCKDIMADKEKQSRLAWHLTDCYRKDTGRPAFPYCDPKFSTHKCLAKLDDNAHATYTEFYLQTNSICHQLQADSFKRQTERLVNDLTRSAQSAEEKLESIEGKAEDLMQSSHQIHDSLASIDIQTQQVAKITRSVEDHVHIVLQHSEAVYEQSKEIAASQSGLQEGQAQMKHKLEESMAKLQESYSDVVQEISRLKEEALEIEKKMGILGEAMTSKMNTLQSKADDIGNVAGISLDKQKKLLDGQSVALEGLQFLTKFQSQAIEESRNTLQQLAALGHKQQDDLLGRQELLQHAHDRLTESSKEILAAQEAFEMKQASMFTTLDKLFNLHNAMLLESRLIKAFIIYSISMFVIHMFTSTKQTYAARPRFYLGLCASFLIEFAILRYATTSNIGQQAHIICLVRSLFVLAAAIQFLHAIYAFRDYPKESFFIVEELKALLERQQLCKDTYDTDTAGMTWSSLAYTELTEDVDDLEDPDYLFPEEVGENSVATTSTTRTYNLRKRHHS